MAKDIVIDPLDKGSIKSAIRELRLYKAWIAAKENELRIRLATLGATVASIQFSRAIYNGTNDVAVRVDNTGSVAVIYAEGKAVAFIEFGSGAKYGYGHPDAARLGTGPGTYPDGKGHWDDPRGWWYGHGKHSYGNPPAMAMYQAREQMVEQLTQIARQVFAK
jgi:hypothetical protein